MLLQYHFVDVRNFPINKINGRMYECCYNVGMKPTLNLNAINSSRSNDAHMCQYIRLPLQAMAFGLFGV